MLDVVVLTTRISTIDFFLSVLFIAFIIDLREVPLAVELEKGELETFTGFNPWFPINALVEEAIICTKDPYQITSALLHL